MQNILTRRASEGVRRPTTFGRPSAISSLRAICLIAAAIATSCSGPNSATVSGTITLDGQPLPGASVSFYPDGDGKPPASGQTDAQGRYSLSTGSSAGLAPGKYVAVVVATKDPPQPYDSTGAEVPPIPITPAKYGDATKSDLRIEVKPGKNDIPLALQSNKPTGS
jgi:hypothetical protein